MVKAVTSSYITQENRNQGAQFVYKITYQRNVGTTLTIPPSEVIEAPSIYNSIGRDFLALSGGDVSVVLDNRSRQWDSTYANAYNRAKYDGDLRISAGFKLASGSDETVELFSGKIINIEQSGVPPHNAVLTARNAIGDKIEKTVIGQPTNSGTPNPYLYGALNRVRLINLLSPDRNTWTFQYGGTINWLSVTPEVLVRTDEISNWRTVTPASLAFSEGTKTVRLNNAAIKDYETQVWYRGVRKNSPGTQLPYIINDILINHVGLPATHINATSIQKIRNLEIAGSWGVQFYDVPAAQAIEQISHALYCGVVVEGKKISLVSLGSPISSGMHLNDTDYSGFSFQEDKSKIINKIRIPYQGFPDNPNKVKQAINVTSQATYGVIPFQRHYAKMSFTKIDSLNVFGASHGAFYQRLANTIIRHNAHSKRIFNLSQVYSKGLRIELGDRVRVSNNFFNINHASAIVIGKNVDIRTKRTDLQLMSWGASVFNPPVLVLTELFDEVSNLPTQPTPGFVALMDEAPISI